MGTIRKVLILANGTVAITQKKSNKRGYFGFFNLSQAATWLMFDPNNFINQLAEHCKEEHCLVLDGPGTDISNDNGSILKSIGALIDGHIGDNGINANFNKIKQFLKKQSKEAAQADETLVICAVGWSRGSFLLSQITEWLKQKSVVGDIKVQAVYIHCIDSVAGGPTDRVRYLLSERAEYNEIPMNLWVHNYLSNTGNLNLWDFALKYLPEKYQINTPFFSAVIDKNKNTTYSIEGIEYTHNSINWLFPATHEALVGRSKNQIDKWAGDIVRADIVRNLINLSFNLDEVWAKEAIKKGQIALEELRQCDISWATNRKFLDFDQVKSLIFGRESKEDDHINLFHDMGDFTCN